MVCLHNNNALFLCRCPVMLVSGEYSPHLNDTVNMNGRLDPTTSSWMKVGITAAVQVTYQQLLHWLGKPQLSIPNN